MSEKIDVSGTLAGAPFIATIFLGLHRKGLDLYFHWCNLQTKKLYRVFINCPKKLKDIVFPIVIYHGNNNIFFFINNEMATKLGKTLQCALLPYQLQIIRNVSL